MPLSYLKVCLSNFSFMRLKLTCFFLFASMVFFYFVSFIELPRLQIIYLLQQPERNNSVFFFDVMVAINKPQFHFLPFKIIHIQPVYPVLSSLCECASFYFCFALVFILFHLLCLPHQQVLFFYLGEFPQIHCYLGIFMHN